MELFHCVADVFTVLNFLLLLKVISAGTACNEAIVDSKLRNEQEIRAMYRRIVEQAFGVWKQARREADEAE